MSSAICVAWPVTARDAELTDIERAMGTEAGVLLTGDLGVGKSTLLHAALDRARRGGAQIVRLDQLERSWHSLQARLPVGRRPRLVITADDLRSADTPALVLTEQLVTGGQALLLASASASGQLPSGVRRLLIDARIRRVHVEPFGRTGAAKVLTARLGGPVTVDTAERLWDLTRGNALALRELTEQSLAEGSLRVVRGSWQWQGLSKLPGSRLTDLAGLLLGDLNPDERELADMLALAGSLEAGLPAVTELGEAAESLNRRGVVVTERTGARLSLRLSYPLCASVLRAALPELTARRLGLRIADAIEAAGRRRSEDTARVVTLRLAAGRQAPFAQLRTAIEGALTNEDFATAERLCRTALDTVAGTGADQADGPDADAELALLLGESLAGQRRHVEADTQFRRATRARAAAGPAPRLLRARVLNLAVGLRRPTQAEAVVAEAIGSPGAGGADACAESLALVRLFAGRFDELASAAVTEGTAPVTALALHLRGASETALSLLDPATAARRETTWDHLFVRAWITLHARGVAEATALLDPLRAHATRGGPRHRAQLALLEGSVHRAAGRTVQAMELLRRAAAHRGAGEWFATRAWRLAQLAGALAEHGESAQALCLLDEVRCAQAEELAHPLVADAVELENAVVAARLGDSTAAVRRALGVAERATAAGRVVQARTALHLAARAGAARRAVALLPEGPAEAERDALVIRHVRALSTADGDVLDEVSERFAALGLLPLAAEAAAQASRAHHDRRRARASRAASTELSSRCDARPYHQPTAIGRPETPADPSLTAREREVAALAAAQLSNQEIADRLVLSVRTVENHLYRAYGKLGVTSRSELPYRLGLSPARPTRIA
ncbi:LuxR C-terminal-related transcriptional regulator [Streptomyces sp. NPDC001848]|uniref:helix-turn-helix transcriptional regulator n=1 Tax=Streptomyces sp. NPDC001848 TaxID=3364618 RepID=UPI0036989EE2